MGRPKKIKELKLDSRFRTRLLMLLQGGKVEVKDFGVFQLVSIPPKKMYHNRSKKVITVQGYKRLKFTQSKALKEELS